MDTISHKPEHQNRLRNSLEWLLFVKKWGDWKCASVAYTLIALPLVVILASFFSLLPVHLWVIGSLTAIATVSSLLVSLTFLRLLLALKEPLIRLAKLALVLALGLYGLWIVIYMLPFVFPESPWAYALRYGTDSSRVHVTLEPADCNFLHAPIGSKIVIMRSPFR